MTAAALDIQHMDQAPKLLLRGSSGDQSFVAAVEEMLGLSPPTRPNISVGKGPSLLWLSPTGWLALGLESDFRRSASRLKERLAGRSGDAIDVSDEYEHVRVQGAAAGDLMAAVCPIDVCAAAFAEASVARTLVAGVPAIVHRPTCAAALDLYVDRTYFDYLMSALNAQAREFV